MILQRRTTCRVCGCKLVPAIDLGEQWLQGSFLKEGRPRPPTRTVPMRLLRCDPLADERACGLLQAEYTVLPEVLYTIYWYRSATNTTMRGHLAEIARELAESFQGVTVCSVLDIGCNDGTLLRAFPPGWIRHGIDPSNAVFDADAAEGLKVVRGYFPSDKVSGMYDVVTSIAMFYDLDDPVEFARQVKKRLQPEGVWCFEVAYLPAMLAAGSYDTICHEHIEYYSLATIGRILHDAGLTLHDVSFNGINGGSARCFASHVESGRVPSERLTSARIIEFDMRLEEQKPYAVFQSRAELHRHELVKLIRPICRNGKTIHLYGASTKGNTLLQWCGLDHRLINAAADRNPDKVGAQTLNGIPIISEAASRVQKPAAYLVLPWHFKKEFMERERATVAAGTKMIFPFPEIEVLP